MRLLRNTTYLHRCDIRRVLVLRLLLPKDQVPPILRNPLPGVASHHRSLPLRWDLNTPRSGTFSISILIAISFPLEANILGHSKDKQMVRDMSAVYSPV